MIVHGPGSFPFALASSPCALNNSNLAYFPLLSSTESASERLPLTLDRDQRALPRAPRARRRVRAGPAPRRVRLPRRAPLRALHLAHAPHRRCRQRLAR